MQKPNQSKPAPKWLSFNAHLQKINSSESEGPDAPAPAGKFFNRNLSWLYFNDRVLSEAADETVPTLERLRFAIIVSSNLDEFFMVRVAEVARLARSPQNPRFPDGLSARRALTAIRDHVIHQKQRQAVVLDNIFAKLSQQGIVLYSDFKEDKDLDKEIRSRLPELKYIVRRNTEALPPLLSERIHVFVRFPTDYAIISIEKSEERLVHLASKGNIERMALLERWISSHAKELFPNNEVIEAFPFKIIRDADLTYRTDSDTLESEILEAVEGRTKAKVVRLEVDAPSYSEGALYLAASLGLDSAALYRFDLPLDLRTLGKICSLPGRDSLRYPPIVPQVPSFMAEARNIFDSIRKKDVLLHHPYDSFDVVEKFLQKSARDPHVTHIYHTLYRTSKDAPIVQALINAVKNGKKVTVYVEIKARFDELNNVKWSNELRQAGAKVVNPLGGFKVHCKLTQVIRKENSKDVSYLHLATGNYHPGTARQYTDIGLLTSDEQLGSEVTTYFDLISPGRPNREFRDLMVAPVNLHHRFINLIKQETEFHKQKGRGHIIAKMNSLVDTDIIEALYQASNAGVKIELLVRGICCLRPGVKGMSENIRVMSVVDRFLEHSRIYYFRADGAKQVYLSSADWMPRNFYNRYEIAFPVKDPILKRYLREVILETSLSDNVKAWELNSDGSYSRVNPSGKPLRSQAVFEELSKKQYEGTILTARQKN
jgi:polyphosphate kinase